MKNIIEIGLKLFGLYFFYESANSILELYIQFTNNQMFKNDPISSWILGGLICKVIMYAVLGWIIIVRNEYVVNKLFHKILISSGNLNFSEIKRSDLILILLKLGGFLFLATSIILIFSAVFPFIGIFQIEENSSKVLTGFLGQASNEILKLVFGLILFAMTEKLMSWINE